MRVLAFVVFFFAMGFVTNAFANPSDLFFVVMGGRTSCGESSEQLKPYGIGMYPRFREMIEGLKVNHPSVKISFVMTCLENSPPPSAIMPFVTSDEPNRLQMGNANVVMNTIERMESLYSAPATILIGHSYGGFLGMYLAERLRLKSGIALLASVDPISNQCGPLEVVLGSQECHEAPRNLRNEVIKGAVGQWLNFYQTSDGWVNSGPISEAKNFMMSFRGPHSDIDSDKRTWKEIQLGLSKILQ